MARLQNSHGMSTIFRNLPPDNLVSTVIEASSLYLEFALTFFSKCSLLDLKKRLGKSVWNRSSTVLHSHPLIVENSKLDLPSTDAQILLKAR